MATKIVGAAGRLRANYGKKLREKVAKVEAIQRQKQKCPYCSKLTAKRVSKGIWVCKNCNKKFTSDVYFLGGK